MSKIYFSDLNNKLKECNIGINSDEIEFTPFVTIHHIHDWDHGYDGVNGINVYDDGSYDFGRGHKGTRREFYSDLNEIMDFLMCYIKFCKIDEMIIAPFYRYYQFEYEDKDNDIYAEIYKFLRKNNIRRGERSGVRLPIDGNRVVLEMIVEGAFRGISKLCVFFPNQKILLAPNHHFGITFFSQNIEIEKKTIVKLVKRHDNLRVFENTAVGKSRLGKP